MRPITILAIPIYQELSKKYSSHIELREATKQYILNEITQWSIKGLKQGGNYFFKPKEFSGDKRSAPFEVRLIVSTQMEGYLELKFGNLNAETDQEMYKWDDNDPYRLQKALFLKKVLESKVIPIIEKGEAKGILFSPYDQDGLGDSRLSYFYNTYSKLVKGRYDFEHETEGMYSITKKDG